MDTLESADDVALADKMNAGRKAIIEELRKKIVGQDDVIELVLDRKSTRLNSSHT